MGRNSNRVMIVTTRFHSPRWLAYLALIGLPVTVAFGLLWLYRPSTVPAVLAAKLGPPPLLSPNLVLMLVQLAVILFLSRMLGRLARTLGQPQVVGEMAAGILLGPTLFGGLAPAWAGMLFPAPTLGFLQAISQVGLVLFMFLVGLELDMGLVRAERRTALHAALGSLLLPFAAGVALAVVFYAGFAPPGVGFVGFALFLGVAMSATAFPVLARILKEGGLIRSRLGAAALSCAAVIDVVVWLALALVVATINAHGDGRVLAYTLVGTLAYIAAMFGLVRPVLRHLLARRAATLSHDWLALLLLLVLCSAIATEALGIHALFGAFLAGAVVPRDGGRAEDLIERLEDLVLVLFVPLFFVFTGLRTDLSALAGIDAALAGLALLVTAALAKLVGTWLGARLGGMPTREAWSLGVLMNTRGLVELVILNIGLDIGVISRPLYTLCVLMAVVTTCMTSPLLRRLVRQQESR